MSNLELAVDLKAQLDALRPLNPDQEKRIWQKFRFDWNYHSNNIEGNSLTFGETKSLLLHNITAQGKSLKDHIEITGHNEAIDALVELTRGDAPLSESFFRQLHVLILRERYQVDAITPEGAPTRRWIEVGQYKTGQNHVQTVTGEIFRFAEPIDVPEKMHALLQSINDLQNPTSNEVLLCAARAHYEFVLIHPFDDGNGRMARLLMNLILIKYGFPPAIIKTQNKQEYFAALRQADGGQFDVFAEYIAGCVCVSLQIMLAGARGESIDEPDEQDRKIRMLARLLERKKGNLEVTRTLSALHAVFDWSFTPLAKKLAEKARAFESLYRNLARHVSVNNIYGPTDPVLDYELGSAKTYIRADTPRFAFNVEFINLAYQGMETISHSWWVDVRTDLASYTVEYLGQYGNYKVSGSITKTYDQQLTDEEISALTNELAEEQISAIQNRAGINLANP